MAHIELTEVVAPTKPGLWTFKNARRDDYDDIYARRMYPVFGRRGHALRRAEPLTIVGRRIDELLIGDVCYLEGGVPYRLYNVIWPEWDLYRKPEHIPSFRSEHESFYTDVVARFPEPAALLCPGDHWASEATSRRNDMRLYGCVK
jgi:hypothetical protein